MGEDAPLKDNQDLPLICNIFRCVHVQDDDACHLTLICLTIAEKFSDLCTWKKAQNNLHRHTQVNNINTLLWYIYTSGMASMLQSSRLLCHICGHT